MQTLANGRGLLTSRQLKPIRAHESITSQETPVVVSNPGGASEIVSRKGKKGSEPRQA